MAVLRGKAASIVKKEVAYQSNPVNPACKNCKNFYYRHIIAMNKLEWDEGFQCSLNHIAVGKNGVCIKHESGEPVVDVSSYAG